MSLFRALISDLSSSKERKVSIHVEELTAETLTAIKAVEEQFRSGATEIAETCRRLVITLPRGEDGFDRAYKLYFDLKKERSPLHASAWIASRLILADHVVERAGGKGLLASGGVSLIQKYIEEFFRRHNVPAWQAPYYEYRFFDVHREHGSLPAEG